MRYIVVHTIRAGQRTIRTPKLAITDVPEKTSGTAVASVLEQSGKAVEFSEAGVPWGNHEVKSDKSLKDIEGIDDVPAVSWAKLQETREVRRITLRLPAQDYALVLQAAKRSNMSIQKWCEAALAAAASKEDRG